MNLEQLAAYVRGRCKLDSHTGCLLWVGAVSRCGTPVFRLRGFYHSRSPRRLLWEADGRETKDNFVFVKPKCDDRCIEPSHQHYITRRQAVKMAAKAGLLSSGAKHAVAIRDGCRKRPHVILNEQKVAAMRARYAEVENAAQVAREFGIGHALAWRVVRNKAWRQTTPFSGLGA